jgi:hypothetical protein
MAIQEINLLPPERRRRVRNESIAVSVTDIVKSINAGLFLMTLLGGAIVASLWLYQVATTDTTKEELTVVVDEYKALRDQVAEQNAVLERLAALGEQRIVWSEILTEFFAATPPGVTLHRMNGGLIFAAGELESGELVLSGQAAARPLLITYEGQLRNLKHVVTVNSPTSNLLERTNPPFQFSLTLSPEE